MCIITFSLSKLGHVDPLSISCGQNKVLSAMTRSSILLRFRESNDKFELKKSYGAGSTGFGCDQRCSLIAPVISLIKWS